MPIDLLREQPVTVVFARKTLIPHFGDKPISPVTASRWIENGVLAGDGSRVRLEAVKIGRQFMTTRESVRRLFEELTRRSAGVVTDAVPGIPLAEDIAAQMPGSSIDAAGI